MLAPCAFLGGAHTVYLMDELAEMARSSPEAAEKVADRIAKRLQNKSPVVKYKVRCARS